MNTSQKQWPAPTQNSRRLSRAGRILRLFLALLWYFSPSAPVKAQGTIHMGFEEFAPGTTPPLVQQVFPFKASPRVADYAAVINVPQLEGNRFLIGTGAILIYSPDSAPISAFTVHYYVDRGPAGPGLSFGGVPVFPTVAGSWQTFSRALATPVSSLGVAGFWGIEGEPLTYALDSIDLVTIPEPSTVTLFALGSGTLALPLVVRRRRG